MIGRAAVRGAGPIGQPEASAGSWLGRAVPALAGPALICLPVLTVLYLFAFRGRISIQYPDVLPFWLPTYCFLGKSLASGAVPAWNPHVMGGVPFAADPQSGWMYLPAMALFAGLPCDVAIRWFIVLQPLLAGLGLYWFLTGEGVSRPAATVGGLALALPLAGSHLVLNLPFAGTLAWTPMVLAAASRFLSAEMWPRRLLWLALTAGAWGQVAAANLSDGLVIATTALAAFVMARCIRDVKRGIRPGRHAILLGALLVLALPLLTLAYFVPRLSYLPRTSIAMGYHRLDELTRVLTGNRGEYLPFEGGTGPAWPARLALSPGVYLGATSLGVVFAWWRAARFRALSVAFAALGLMCYLLMLQAVARLIAPALPEFIRSFYVHDPSRFRFGLLIAMAVLAAIGMEGWFDAPAPLQRFILVLPALLVWGIAPPLVGAGIPSLLLPLGAAAGLIALSLAAWRPAFVWLVPAVLAVELTANGLVAQLDGPPPVNRALLPRGPLPAAPAYRRPPRETSRFPGPINTLETPTIRASEFVRPTGVARFLQQAGDGRYLTVDRIVWDPRGYHVHQRRHRWERLGMQQSMLFGLQEAQGYNPVQLMRYWTFVRGTERKPIRYNAAFFVQPPPIALDVLHVEWLIVSRRRTPPLPGAVLMQTQGDWMLFRLPDAPPRASVVTSWETVSSSTEALELIRDPAFTARATAVVENPAHDDGKPASSSSSRPGEAATASYMNIGPQEAHITVNAPSGGLVLVRNAYDSGWHATVDGQPAKVTLANYLVQGINVAPGRHRIILRYDDPSVGVGFLGSGLSASVLLAAAFVLRRRA